jgi:hypothetical protein
MKIAMHSNNLCARGVPKSVYKYSHYLESLFNHEIVCIYYNKSKFNDDHGIAKFSSTFKTYGYDEWPEVIDILREESVDLLYMQKAGSYDGKLSNEIPTLIHSVFQEHDPHGAVYAYISEWLSETVPGNHDYVPYIVELPDPNKDLRSELDIPEDALIFGRHGAYTQFNLKFVHQCVYDIANNHDDIYFLFMNTEPFSEHLKNIIHLPISADEQVISNFINTCDSMIHARAMGESFGLAIAEFLHHDKPVISYHGGHDRNHIYMMDRKGIWYKDYETLKEAILNFKRLTTGSYKDIVAEYSPERVMNRFNQVFIKKFL